MKAMIFGVTGQDGGFLAELLVDKGYEVYGVARRTSNPNDVRLAKTTLLSSAKFHLLAGDVTDYSSVFRLISEYHPDEVYNLAAQSHVKVSFDEPIHTTNVVYGGCLNILEVLRHFYEKEQIRFYQASSSEMFGTSYFNKGCLNPVFNGTPPGDYYIGDNIVWINKKVQNEQTSFSPCSPYAIAKLAAHHAVHMYRNAYGIHASSGILFNHESERRGEAFVTRKITKYVASVKNGVQKCKLELGNLDAVRDWGYAKDYCEAMWLMLQQAESADYVIGTGETHTVREFLAEAFACIGITDYEKYVHINKDLYRPNEVSYLCADASKAKQVLGWSPKVSFKQLVQLMVENDINART